MFTRKHLPLLAAICGLGLTLPALAQDVPADAGKALWCANAFSLVEPQARGAGDIAAADNFKKYADTLTTTSHDLLDKAGFTAEQIKATNAKYADTVNKELSGTGTIEFSVVECTQLVDPAAAAAIQAAPADGNAPADAAPAPDATPAAPASK